MTRVVYSIHPSQYFEGLGWNKLIAGSEHGSCRELARRKVGARAVQTGNETALNELVPIRKFCSFSWNHPSPYTLITGNADVQRDWEGCRVAVTLHSPYTDPTLISYWKLWKKEHLAHRQSAGSSPLFRKAQTLSPTATNWESVPVGRIACINCRWLLPKQLYWYLALMPSV